MGARADRPLVLSPTLERRDGDVWTNSPNSTFLIRHLPNKAPTRKGKHKSPHLVCFLSTPVASLYIS